MIKKLLFVIYKFFYFLNSILIFLTKKNFLVKLKELIENNSYKKIIINQKTIYFFTPNKITDWRVSTFFTKEPETLKYIDNFKKKIIFWDIGANIGLYSIYNALKNKESVTISFEASLQNLRVLSRNISINNLKDRIHIMPIALSNKNKFQLMKENSFEEGSALNSFGKNCNFEGKRFKFKNNYSTYGTSLNSLVESNILKIPNYIKIDVDGIEHLILSGFDKYLSNKKIESVLIEVNENFSFQFKEIVSLMKFFKFKLQAKHKSLYATGKFNKSFNYLYNRS